MKTNLLGMTAAELETVLGHFNELPYRARQIYHSIYGNRVADINDISNLGLELRQQLTEIATLNLPNLIENIDADDETQKLLFQLNDDRRIESVIIRENKRVTACVSSQVGCVVGCKFCATGGMGFIRNLTAGEIIGQYFRMEQISGLKITNIVFMGMGEPLLNRRAVFKAINLLTDPGGIGFSHAKITISTFGLVPGIEAMIKENLKVKLAVSLSATTEKQRRAIIPTYARYSIPAIIKAANKFALSSGNRVSINYLLLNNVNDSDNDAERLAILVRDLRSKVNIMEFNDGYGDFSRSENFQVDSFVNILIRNKVNVTRRKSKGENIGAACGQLAAGYAMVKP